MPQKPSTAGWTLAVTVHSLDLQPPRTFELFSLVFTVQKRFPLTVQQGAYASSMDITGLQAGSHRHIYRLLICTR